MKRAGSILESTARQPKTDGEENVHIIPDDIWMVIFKIADIIRYYADMQRNYNKFECRYRPHPNSNGYLPLVPRLVCKKFYNIINEYTQVWHVMGSFSRYIHSNDTIKDNGENFLSIVNSLSTLKRLILGWNYEDLTFDKPTGRCLQGITAPVEVLTISHMYINNADCQIRFAKFLKNNTKFKSIEIVNLTSSQEDMEKDMKNTNMRVLFCVQLAASLQENKTLTDLKLTHVFTTNGLKEIAKCLTGNTTLRSLHVLEGKHNGINIYNLLNDPKLNYKYNITSHDRVNLLYTFSKYLKNNTTLQQLTLGLDEINETMLNDLDEKTLNRYKVATEYFKSRGESLTLR